MPFWGIEVKPGQTLKCRPDYHCVLHIRQVVLGESEGGSGDAARVYVKVDGSMNKVAIGVLSEDKFPQVQLDLRLHTGFELSNTSKTASVFFSGYEVYHSPV